MDSSLYQHRVRAADCSGGISGTGSRDLVLRLVRQKKLSGHLLDYGAGVGGLTRLLEEEKLFDSTTGVDIMARPEDLPAQIRWFEQDLNEPFETGELYDVIVSSEVIEHLENPRATFRNLAGLLRPGGTLVLTTPNQESVRSYLAFLVGGHFAAFLGASYPAHITALLRLDCQRICAECGFEPPQFHWTDSGGIPKKPAVTWQRVSGKRLKGRLFSDNFALVTTKKSDLN